MSVFPVCVCVWTSHKNSHNAAFASEVLKHCVTGPIDICLFYCSHILQRDKTILKLYSIGETEEETSAQSEDDDEDEEDDDDSDIDDGELEDEGDRDFNPDDDPEKLWCFCKQPHGNRFMICCDTCEEWFHGECVGISMAMGREMEKAGEEWCCNKCKGKNHRLCTEVQNYWYTYCFMFH